MEDEIFRASEKEKQVKALGILVNCALQDLHVYVNGVDITRTTVLEEIRVTVEKKGA